LLGRKVPPPTKKKTPGGDLGGTGQFNLSLTGPGVLTGGLKKSGRRRWPGRKCQKKKQGGGRQSKHARGGNHRDKGRRERKKGKKVGNAPSGLEKGNGGGPGGGCSFRGGKGCHPEGGAWEGDKRRQEILTFSGGATYCRKARIEKN